MGKGNERNGSTVLFLDHVHNIDNRIIMASSIVRSVAPIYSILGEEILVVPLALPDPEPCYSSGEPV